MSTLNISRKSSGNYFVGTPSNDKQTLVLENATPEQIAAFFQQNKSKVIKAEYRRSTTYFGDEITNPATWQKVAEKIAAATAKAQLASESWRLENERKDAVKKAVADEAATISLDEQFTADVKAASLLQGEEKSKRSAAAMKGLLERKGIEKIATDFWKVYRMLKSQVK